jgi:Leucine-rich repeat (LRR) protein
MKTPYLTPSLLLTFSAMLLSASPGRAQDLRQDTLAVRILLDNNGLTATPVAQVVDIDPAEGRVTALRLNGLKLASLPTQIGVLDALKYLVLSDNLLDSLPASLWDLANLVELDLGGNRVTSLSPGISRLKTLLFLGLRANALTALPESLFALPHLETLLLANNGLDTLPETVANLAFLKYLDLSGNALRALPYTLAAMDALDSLDLNGNEIASLPASITLMPATSRVRLGGNRLCDLGSEQTEWANGKDPSWRESQVCGSPIRYRARASRAPSLRAFVAGGSLRLDWAGTEGLAGTRRIVLRDVTGREILRRDVGADAAGLTLPRAATGFWWAEFSVGGRVVAKAAAVAF